MDTITSTAAHPGRAGGSGMCLLDIHGIITGWSADARQLFGYRAPEVIGRHYALLFDQEAVAAQTPAHLLRLARERGCIAAQGNRVRKDGAVFAADVVITALADDTGEATGLSVSTRPRDLCPDAGQVEAQVVRNIEEGITVLDRGMRYRLWNPCLERLTGIAQDQVLDRHVLDVFPTLEGDERIAYIQAALQGVYSRAGLTRLPPECTSQDWIATEYIPLRDAGDAVSGVIVTVRDASERMEQQARIERLASDELRLESQLRRALAQDEFVLHYQPKLDTASRAVVGVEALLRWNDPERGLVQPGEFIPLLEKTGLIVDVGRWVIARACADHRACLADGLRLPPIAVNVSVRQLQSECFLPELRALAREFAGEPGGRGLGAILELEITESMVMENVGAAIDTLGAIRAMGLRTSIDDFGTGYSSLSYLAQLPIDALKIDRSFIGSMTHDQAGMAIVSSTVLLAHSLNLQVVAEGVELEEHARFLRHLKCDQMQGYLFSRPLALDALRALLA